jgi:hypothetical protein
MKNTVHKYENVIVGSSLEALLYSYITKYPVFFAGLKCPFEFEHFEPAFSFSLIQHTTKKIYSNFGEIEVGINKLELWNNLFFLLSMAGQIPIAREPNSMRIDNGTLRINSNNKLIVVEPKNILLFDDLDVEGLGYPKEKVGNYVAYDFIEFNSMYPHPYEYIKDDTNNIISKLWFLEPTNNIRFKDGCLVSYFKKKKQMEQELADYNLKFRLKDIFKEYGLKGKANGFHHVHKHIQRYKQVRYTFGERIIVEPKNVYESVDNISYMSYDVPQLISNYSPNYMVDRLWNQLKIL